MKIFGVIDTKIDKADDPDQIGDLQNHHSENGAINFGLPGGREGENGGEQDDDGFNTRAAGLDIGRELRRNDKRPGDVCFRPQEPQQKDTGLGQKVREGNDDLLTDGVEELEKEEKPHQNKKLDEEKQGFLLVGGRCFFFFPVFRFSHVQSPEPQEGLSFFFHQEAHFPHQVPFQRGRTLLSITDFSISMLFNVYFKIKMAIFTG